jgi:hypothetical protein
LKIGRKTLRKAKGGVLHALFAVYDFQMIALRRMRLFFLYATLGSLHLHGAFICAYWNLAT